MTPQDSWTTRLKDYIEEGVRDTKWELGFAQARIADIQPFAKLRAATRGKAA